MTKSTPATTRIIIVRAHLKFPLSVLKVTYNRERCKQVAGG